MLVTCKKFDTWGKTHKLKISKGVIYIDNIYIYILKYTSSSRESHQMNRILSRHRHSFLPELHSYPYFSTEVQENHFYLMRTLTSYSKSTNFYSSGNYIGVMLFDYWSTGEMFTTLLVRKNSDKYKCHN